MSLVDKEIDVISDDEEDSGASDAKEPPILDSLIKIQKKVVRDVTFSSYTESSKPLYQKLEILNGK